MTKKIKKYALISVYDKKNISKFASQLVNYGYNLIVTEGTGRELKKHKIPFILCEKVSQNPSCFDGYMKTMSFSIEAGIFFDRSNSTHRKEAKKFNVKDIDIVVCNFFPLKKVFANLKNIEIKEIVRNFDFGGPTMVRIAAQNFKNVVVIVDYKDYKKVIRALSLKDIPDKIKYSLAVKAFRHISSYDNQILKYLNKKNNFYEGKRIKFAKCKKNCI